MLIRTLRRRRAWSQEQLAVILGVNVRTVQRLEHGARPSLETAQALASAFDCEPQAFLRSDAAAAVQIRGVELASSVRPDHAPAKPPCDEAPFGGVAGVVRATGLMLVGGAFVAILTLALLIAGPGTPALTVSLITAVMGLVGALRAVSEWRPAPGPPQ